MFKYHTYCSIKWLNTVVVVPSVKKSPMVNHNSTIVCGIIWSKIAVPMLKGSGIGSFISRLDPSRTHFDSMMVRSSTKQKKFFVLLYMDISFCGCVVMSCC